ncbi:hypothetical protein VTK73DRAFT_6309 [Phialemonium thermophilum]|uniref:Secreted protein n=1 Tax=Phialemonium thermophilum TaxID=223376 RepID=A0ABR3UZP4_9PEZI
MLRVLRVLLVLLRGALHEVMRLGRRRRHVRYDRLREMLRRGLGGVNRSRQTVLGSVGMMGRRLRREIGRQRRPPLLLHVRVHRMGLRVALRRGGRRRRRRRGSRSVGVLRCGRLGHAVGHGGGQALRRMLRTVQARLRHERVPIHGMLLRRRRRWVLVLLRVVWVVGKLVLVLRRRWLLLLLLLLLRSRTSHPPHVAAGRRPRPHARLLQRRVSSGDGMARVAGMRRREDAVRDGRRRGRRVMPDVGERHRLLALEMLREHVGVHGVGSLGRGPVVVVAALVVGAAVEVGGPLVLVRAAMLRTTVR